MNSAFERAKEVLQIRSVVLRDFSAMINEETDPLLIEEMETQPQGFRFVKKVRETSKSSDESDFWEYNFFYSVGARLINNTEEGEEEHVLLEITATFNAIYSAEEKLEKESLEAFSEENVGYHVWPYWREFVQSSCSRLNVPLLQTPMYFRL